MARKKPDPQNKPLSMQEAKDLITQTMNDLLAGIHTGPLSLRLKPTKKPGETYPLKLTQHQRSSLIQYTRIPKKVKDRLLAAPDGMQVMDFTRKDLSHMDNEIGQAAVDAPHPDKKRLMAVIRKISELLAADRQGLLGEEIPAARQTAPQTGDRLYQFKITLLGIKPVIWRRIQVPECTLEELHESIQAAFGWWNYHLHEFTIDGQQYGPQLPKDFDYGEDVINEAKVSLKKLIPASRRKCRWIYEYDFGDGWRHEVVFEGFVSAEPKAKYPVPPVHQGSASLPTRGLWRAMGLRRLPGCDPRSPTRTTPRDAGVAWSL